jgi:dolichyl-phosphate beta-glucosyltransferase
MRLSVVIPAYNEAGRLPATLRAVVGFLSDHPQWRPAEIIVVDDGSSDGTAAVVGCAPNLDGITLACVSHEANRGKGAAVRTGFARSRGELVLLSDADLATPISEIGRLAGEAPGGIAIGSRALDRGRIESRQPIYRDLMGRVFNLAVRIFAVQGIRDTQCGFKLVDGALGRDMASVQRIDGFAFDVELLLLAKTWGVEVREVSVRWRHVEESRVQPVVHSADMFLDLLRIGWWRLTGAVGERPSSPQ